MSNALLDAMEPNLQDVVSPLAGFPSDPCLSGRHLAFRINSNGSFVDSDGDFRASQESHISLSELEALVETSDQHPMALEEALQPPAPSPLPAEFLPEDEEAQLRPSTPDQMVLTEGSLGQVTPEANLKLLMSAISPELRQRERLRELNGDRPLHFDPTALAPPPAKGFVVQPGEGRYQGPPCKQRKPSRHERSLGLLCTRFLQRLPNRPNDSDDGVFTLDDEAKSLGVERRRLYDIVNVLESLELVSRIAKNKYAWHGMAALAGTLARIRAQAEADGLGQHLQASQDAMAARDAARPRKRKRGAEPDPPPWDETSSENSCDSVKDGMRKDNSLGVLSRRFMALFLVSQTKVVNLELSGRILLGEGLLEHRESARLKTKIRRLYDIANILTSLGLICKVKLPGATGLGKRPAFKYTGPSLDPAHDDAGCLQVAKDCSSAKSIVQPPAPASQKTPFSRHSSFDLICDVAEQERNRLYFESSSQQVQSDAVSADVADCSPPAEAKTPQISVCEGRRQSVVSSKNGQPLEMGDPEEEATLKTTKRKEEVLPDTVTFTSDQLSAILDALQSTEAKSDVSPAKLTRKTAKRSPSQPKPLRLISREGGGRPAVRALHREATFTEAGGGRASAALEEGGLPSPVPLGFSADDALLCGLESPLAPPPSREGKLHTPVNPLPRPDLKVIKEGLSSARVSNAMAKVLHKKTCEALSSKPQQPPHIIIVHSGNTPSPDYLTPVSSLPTGSSTVRPNPRAVIQPSAGNIINLGEIFASPQQPQPQGGQITRRPRAALAPAEGQCGTEAELTPRTYFQSTPDVPGFTSVSSGSTFILTQHGTARRLSLVHADEA